MTNFLEILPHNETEPLLYLGSTRVSKTGLVNSVEHYAALLQETKVKRVGVMLDNGIDLVALDLACMQLSICIVPIPVFFSQQQVSNTIASASLDLFISIIDCEQVVGSQEGLTAIQVEGVATKLRWQRLEPEVSSLMPEGTHKITFTSGSTGAPKGVCLSTNSQLSVAHSLVRAVDVERPKHLCLLPFSVLLENIAGVYAPLIAGGSVTILPLQQLGFAGSRLASPERLLASIVEQQPNTLILVPELLLVLTQAAMKGWQVPTSLKFVAVGGAKVSPRLLEQARQLGIPVFQGYGLSECASVIALSNSSSNSDSVGQLLPHSQGHVVDGNWHATANLFLGYIGQPDSFYPKFFNTGDRVTLTENNELNIIGRSKNLIVNSFGRNIQPEWIEAELMASGLLSFVVVLGEAQARLHAVLLSISPAITEQQIQSLISKTNDNLPDYARIACYKRMATREELTPLLRVNNQPNRSLFERAYSRTFAVTAA